MSRYLAMLRDEERKNENAGGSTLKNLKNHIEGSSLGFLGTPPAHFQKHETAENIIETPANDPSPAGGEVHSRPPLVSEDDLHQIMRHLLTHLATCRDCVVEDHLYCQQGGRDGSGYQGFLCEFPDAEQRHADYVAVVIQARIRGLQAGFTALDALTRLERDTGRETAGRPVYGIEARPAELAFVNHFTACAYCFPRSGKYCGEGRRLHQEARREGVQ